MAGKKRLFSEIMGPPESAASTSHDIVFKDAKKNLLDTFTSTQAGDPGSDHMKCYLRIRPMSSEEIERGEDQKCLEVEGENSVITHAPKDSHAYKNYTYGLGKTNTKFTFSKIFSENTTQKEFFDRTMLGLARDFIDGQNCLVFSYGITSSGKTYTIQGKPHDAGLLPRVLDVLFNSIEGKQWPGMDLKPVMFTDVKKLSPEEEKEEKRIKEKTLRMSLDDDTDVMTLLGDDISDMSQGNTTTASEASNASTSTANHKDSMDSDIFAEVQNRVREEAAVSVEDQGQIKFSVWVSFAEIYNEQIFDLLEPIPKKKNARRNILKLSDDKNGSPYIKGLREINVSNADEAYRLLSIGQRNLRTACTKLNQNSSRSHCIFNIKVLRVVNTRHPRVARISMLSLCDLAGSERQSKTQAVGVKLTEASNINTSLMMLGRCIEALRYNQTHKDNQRIVPFRDSKLTRIFQNFFSGQGKAAMIINVSPSPTVFDETLRVFKFSAIAKQVIVLQKPKEKEPKVHNRVAELSASARPSIQWASPGTMLKFGSQMNVTSSEDNDDDEELSTRAQVEELLNIVDFLQKELRSERASKLHHEAKIREEVCKEMMAQMVEIEDQYSERLRECDQMAEELVEKRVKLLMEYQPPPKRQRQDKMTDDEDEWVSSVLLHAEEVKVKQRDEKITGLEEEVSQLKNELMNLSHIRDSVTKDKTAFEFALADKKRELLGVISDKEKAVDSLHTAKDELNESKQTINTLQKQLKQAKRQSVETSIQKELEVARTTVDELQEQLKQALSSVSDTGDGALLESLSQQLQTARETQKKQEQEIEELNEMLSEAGETFQQKEQEIARLKTELLDGDKKINEQEETIKRLRQALEESTRAVQESEIRLQHKTERISALVEERQQIQEENDELVKKVEELQEKLDALDGIGEEETKSLLAQKDEEIQKLRTKLKLEEEDAIKRDQALIHGYNAEIASYKAQITELKTRLREATGASPQKSPRKTPKKTPQKKEDDAFKNHLCSQIKGFQTELDKNSCAVSELKQALEIAHSAAADLEKKLETESSHHDETRIALAELREKMKCSIEERDETISQLKNQGEKFSKDLEFKSEHISELEFSLEELKCSLQSLQEEKEKLTSERSDLLEVVASKDTLIVDHVDVKETLKEKLGTVQEDLKKKEKEIEALQKSVEELEMVKSELKQMLNASTSQQEKMLLEKMMNKDNEMEKQISAQKEQFTKVIAEKEVELVNMKEMLVSRSEEHQKLLDQKDAEKVKLEKDLEHHKDEVMALMKKKEEELQAKVVQINELVCEIEILKRETSEKTVVCEKVKSDLQRLEKDSSEIETLKTTCQASKERLAELQNQLSEKESKNKELEASLEEIHSALSGKEKEFEGSVLRLRGELEQAHDQLQEKESKLLKQEETMKLLESRVCDMDETCKEVKLEQVSIIQKLSNVNEASQQMEQKAREAESIIREKEEEVAGLQDELQRREDKVKMLTKEHRAEISDLKTELGAKEHELEQVQKSYSDMQALLSSSDAKLSQLSEASLEIAELKSALHMEKTLHVKYQTELEEAVSEKEKVEAALTTCQENLKVALEKEGNAEAEAERRQESLRAVTTAKQEIEQRLEECQHKLTVMEQKSSERESQLKDLQDQLVENKDEKEELESKLKETDEMFRKEKEACKMLQDQVDGYAHELNQVKTSEETHLSEAKEQLQEKLKLSSERIADLEKQLMTAEEKVTGYEREIEKLDSERKKGAMKENVGSSVNESKGHGFDFSELRGELEAEQKKNNEFHKLVENMTGDMDSTSGNARKLRKEKIEAECALVNAKYEIKSLKRKLDRCQGGTLVLSPTKLADSDNRKWDESEKKLQVLQDKHAKCVEELEECRSKITTLEQKVDKLKSELLEKKQEVLALSRSAESSAKERTSSSSVTSTDSFVHDELQRSQERERNLRQQLQQASESMKENITRISELEEQLTGQQNTFLETQDKMEALQKEKDKLCLEQTTSDELKQEMKQLRADLERKSEKLEQRSTALKDLKRAQEAERERFEVALRDAKANENVIEQLKVALTEQEETMAAQDKVMNNKDDENKALSEELEKMTEKYRQMLDQRGDSSRELRDNMKALTKAEVERDEMKREVDKLNSERNQKDIVIRENNHEIKELEKSLAEKRQEIVELKSSVDREVHKHVEDKKAETNATIEDLKTKLRAKEHDLRKIEREIQKYEDQLREMRKQVTDKEQEMEAWREHRDKLVGSLEALMKKQAAEIKELKHERDSVHIKEEVTSQMEEKEARINELEGKLQNLEHMMTYNQRTPGGSGARGRKRSTVNANPDMDHLKKQLEQEREDKLELQKQLRVVQKASDHIVADLKASNTQLQVQVAALQGVPPPPKPPRVDPAFVNDDYPTEGRHQIDVTPPVAAKALKKSGRKRVTAKEETAAPDSDETPRTKRGRGRPSKTKKEADPAPVECLARIVEEETQKKRTRSAKKSSADVPVVVTEVDLDAGNKRGKRGRRKLYSEEVSAPFECAPFVPPTATTSKVDVHNVVQRRLRGRRTNMTDV